MDISNHGTVPAARKISMPLWLAGVAVLALALHYGATHAAQSSPTLASFIQWTPALLHGFLLNILISVTAIVAGSGLGLAVGGLAMSKSFLGTLARAWVQFFRNAPWLVLIYFTSYVFPFELHLGHATLPFPDWLKVTAGLALPASANIAEIFRGAVASIPATQWEAASSLAFSRRQILFTIIFPQCIRRMLPPWMNLYAIVTMGTALASLVGIHDLLDTAQIAAGTVNRSSFTVLTYFAALGIFFAYCYPISRITRGLERRYQFD